VRIRGEGGEVRAGARVAATLGPWTLERPPDRLSGGSWVLAAAVRQRDAFWSAHGGRFDLVLPAGSVAWIYRGVGVAWGEQAVSISGIGKPEVS